MMELQSSANEPDWRPKHAASPNDRVWMCVRSNEVAGNYRRSEDCWLQVGLLNGRRSRLRVQHGEGNG